MNYNRISGNCFTIKNKSPIFGFNYMDKLLKMSTTEHKKSNTLSPIKTSTLYQLFKTFTRIPQGLLLELL